MLLDFDPIEVEDGDLDDDDIPLVMKAFEQLARKSLKAAPIVKGIGSNYYDFLYHAMNSSIGTASPNSTICENSTNSLEMYSSHFWESMKMG